MLCTVWLQKQLVPRDTDRRTCENCSPHLHSSKISLSSAMSKKREKSAILCHIKKENARAHKANGWEKQVKPKLIRSMVQQ